MEYMRESIIVSSIRIFCKSFAAIIGVMIGFILVFVGILFFSSPDIYPPKGSMTIAADAHGNRNLLPAHSPVILKIDINGIIGQGDLTETKFRNILLDSREEMLAGNRVKAVLLCINTPGGTTDDSDAIYRALVDYKKKYQVPVYAFVDGLCASGGMYIASAADKILATPPSVIGSVGVILGPTFNFSGLMDRYGVQSMTLSQGKDKDMLNPFRPWVPGEDASLRAVTASLYTRFVSIVTENRLRLSKDKLVNEYGAQVFIAKQAEDLGFIDISDADYEMAVEMLAKEAKFSEDQAYQVFNMKPSHPFLADLTEGRLSLLSGKVTHQFQFSSSMNSELSGRFLYLYQPN